MDKMFIAMHKNIKKKPKHKAQTQTMLTLSNLYNNISKKIA